MGSLCNSNATTTSTYTPSPQGSQLYGQVINSAEQAASTPYQPYTGELTAGLSGTQQAGISNINAASGIASPYINQAAGYAAQGASPISSAQISNYENPYQSDVINSTLANINETNTQQQQALKGNAITSGAYGGDRAGIAQAELARQQGLASNQTIAGLNAQNYNQALTAAQADRAAAGQGAYALGNIGSLAQNTALTGAGAQLQAGGLQQGTQQAVDTAAYNQYLQQLAFPYQQAQFLAGVGIPAAGGLGGTQTTTAPPPSLFSQIAGLGVAGLGVAGGLGYKPFSARGGRIGYANGGSTPYGSAFNIANAGGIGWIPSVQIQSPQIHQFGTPQKQQGDTSPFASGLQAFKKYAPKDMFSMSSSPTALSPDGGGFTPSAIGSFDPGTTGGTGMEGFGGLYARGGLVDAVHHIRGALRARRYADGGDVFADRFAGAADTPYPERELPFDSRWIDVPQRYPQSLISGLRDMASAPAPPAMATAASAAPLASGEEPSPLASAAAPSLASADLPPEILAGQSAPSAASPQGPLAYDQASPMAGPASAQSAPVAAPSGAGGFLSRLGQKLSDPDVSSSLLSAGLGIMAGTSPYGLANIGAGGLKGVQEYDTLQERRQKATQEGQRLAQQLLLHREITPYQQGELESKKTQQEQTAKYQAAQVERQKAALEEQKRQHDLSLKTPVKIGDDPRTGMPIMALPRSNPNGGIDYYMIGPGGQISDTPMGAPQSGPPLTPGGPGPSSALPSSPANAAAPVRTAALDLGNATDAPKPGEGTRQYNARITQAAQTNGYDYGTDAPYIEKGMEVPEPSALAGRSIQSLKTDSEYYLETGKLPPVAKGNSPVAIVQQKYQNAVKNYGNALAQSRGMSPQEVADAWRSAPGALRFILGAPGQATVSLGTAVRHLDTLQDYAKAWNAGDVAAINRISALLGREFGGTAATNLETVAHIVGPEIVKAIGIAGAGTKDDRDGMIAQFTTARSLPQVLGAIEGTQRLMAGQLEGKERQALNAGVSHARFRSLIGDRPYEILAGMEKGGGQGGAGGAASPNAVPAATAPRVRQNGHTYERQQDGSYKAID